MNRTSRLTLLPLLLLSSSLHAGARVDPASLRIEPQGDTIVIHYRLEGDAGERHNLRLSASLNGTRLTPRTLSGSLQQVRVGEAQPLRWQALADYPKGLQGDLSITLETEWEQSPTWPFTITPLPAHATVKIMNIVPKYQPGMALATGEYDVLVQADGYPSWRETIHHSGAATRQSVNLSDLREAERRRTEEEKQRQAALERDRQAEREQQRQAELKRQQQAEAERQAALQKQQRESANQAFTDLTTGMTFVYIKGGRYRMGSPSDESGRDGDESQHWVTVGDYWIGQYEVTQGEWQKTTPLALKKATTTRLKGLAGMMRLTLLTNSIAKAVKITVCRPKRSGSMRHEGGQRPPTGGEMA
ncbi:hypothetical protein D5085_04020 [Ectothiorhodospiraceae bacterium BW-2]|nr:hypothetical protein D5085_04020 [Ectothiorhodospiraceae bacterium BW-2]